MNVDLKYRAHKRFIAFEDNFNLENDFSHGRPVR